MRTTNFTDLRNNLKKYLDAVTNDSDTVIINRDGGTGAVLISLDEYNAIKETEYIMSSPAMMEAIREGERDIKEGRFVSQQPGESISDFLNRINRTGTNGLRPFCEERTSSHSKKNSCNPGRHRRAPIYGDRKTGSA